MDKQRIKYLHDSHLQQTLSAPEQEEWKSILADPDAESFLLELIFQKWDNMYSEDKIPMAGNRSEEILAQINSVPQPQKRTLALWPRFVAAASIILVIGAGIFYFNKGNQVSAPQVTLAKHNIMPGGYKAYLTLSNGQKMSLTDLKNGNIAKQGGLIITKTADGQVVYDEAHRMDNNVLTVGNNLIETPNGGQYEVRLSDGTKVWLNAASSLKYPASFAKLKERRVELSGEGYFEVAKDKTHPFIVKTDKQEVEVFGTHFNINSYANEESTRTTLLEGSVKVRPSGSSIGHLLNPGQQAQLTNGAVNIEEVNAENVLDWKNGDFIFDNEDFGSIMRKIERWYNVKVVYVGKLQTTKFEGQISRFKKLSEVLRALELSAGVHFTIKGNQLIVLP